MKITKRQLRRIIKEEVRRLRRLTEYGSSVGSVSWYEDVENDVLFDVEGHGDGLTKDQVQDIANESDVDESVEKDIWAAIEEYDDYMYSS